MVSLGKRYRRLVRSFGFAFEGLWNVVRKEQNMQIHLFTAPIVLLFAWLLHLSRTDFFIILILIAGMISLEAMNTAVERVVDLVTEEYHPLAKQAKDIAAAAVLCFAIVAAIIGIAIFYKPFIDLFINS